MLRSSNAKFTTFREGILRPESLDELSEVERGSISSTGKKSEFHLKDMPKILLGEFEILPIKYPKGGASTAQKDYTYFVVQFPINIYPDEFLVDDVRFAVNFKNENDLGVKVIDLYPREKIEELKRNVNLVISPSLTFSEFSAKLADVSFNFVYDEIRPVIYGSGIGLPHAYWNMRHSFSHYIAGTKIMHAIIQAPKTTRKLTINTELQAAVHINNKVVNTIFTLLGFADDLVRDKVSVEFDLKTRLSSK